MATIILLRGYSGSGKSTIAKAWVAEAPAQRMRVNRDDLRESLFNSEGVLAPEQEQIISKVQREAALAALRAGKNVIVDDTNLRAKFAKDWADLAALNGFNFMVQDHHVDIEECVKRNANRISLGQRGVPEEVIRSQAARFPRPWPNIEARPVKSLEVEEYVVDDSLPWVNIFDLDGTLALNKGTRGWYDWSRVGEDMPNEYVVGLHNILSEYSEAAHTIFLSGRDSVCRPETEAWLRSHVEMRYGDALFMRAEGDQRPDDIVKLELFNAHIRGVYNVAFVVDDRPKVCRMWRQLGLPLLQVGTGEEF